MSVSAKDIQSVTCRAPVNIAVIKYWGKRDEKLILPYNDSISASLDMDQMCATTTASASPDFPHDRFWLNGAEVQIADNDRLRTCLVAIRQFLVANHPDPGLPMLTWSWHIASVNNFPTAAGLASSAAGYACLVYAVARLYALDHLDLTVLARLGSGSACRSLYGGFVHWTCGQRSDGQDSRAHKMDAGDWPGMHMLVLVVNETRKKVSSTAGMATTVANSPLYRHRVEHTVPQRIVAMRQAIVDRDFEAFAELTMRDSNQFHAVCLDSYPPIVYMNDVSHRIVALVHQFNERCGATRVAYTFDAGPNAVLYLLDRDVAAVLAELRVAFPVSDERRANFVRGLPVQDAKPALQFASTGLDQVRYIIHTKIGPGAEQIDDSLSLLDRNGIPQTGDM